MWNKIDNKKRYLLFTSNYFTITKLPRLFPLPRLKNLSSACSDSPGLHSSSPLWIVEQWTKQSCLPMLSFYLFLNYKEYWHVKKDPFCLFAGDLLRTSRAHLRIILFSAWKSLQKWPFRVTPGWLLCAISQARVEEPSPPYFVLSVLRRSKGQVSLQEYREQGTVLH